jgi:abhydrolase domain-containing protein 13
MKSKLSISPVKAGFFVVFIGIVISQKDSLVKILSYGALVFVLLISVLVAFQEKLLYVPVVEGYTTVSTNPAGYQSPKEFGIDFEEAFVNTSDGCKVHVWLLKRADPNPSSPSTVIECHGNAGNMGLRLPALVAAHKNLPSSDTVIFDYRGYGSSTGGKPNEEGMVLDLFAVYKWVKERKASKTGKIFLHGRSIGGSLVVKFQARYPEIQDIGLIVENTFTSIEDIAKTMFPVIRPVLAVSVLKALLIRVKWDTVGNLRSFLNKGVKMLLLSAGKDEIVPHSHRVKLLEVGKESNMTNLSYAYFPDSGHNDTWLAKNYWKTILDWMQ